jgi:crotonobetainyl-CoA:carnitine CoA-transferase CaiB-like acyl-CoA transferase
LEAWMSAQPWAVLGYSAEGSQPACIGNRDEAMSPHGVFPCAGTAQWVAISVEDDAQFAALADAMGRPQLSSDPCFATLAARRANEDALEAMVSAWTGPQDPEAVAAALRAAGVTAWPVERMDAVVASEHLAARHFLTRLDHPEFGVRPLAGPPWRASRSPMRATTPAPMLGQHTAEVLRQALGLSAEAIASLDSAGILR